MELYYIEYGPGQYRSRGRWRTSNFDEAAIYPKRHVAERRARESHGQVKILHCSQTPFPEPIEEVTVVIGRDFITDGPFIRSVRVDHDEAVNEAEALNRLEGNEASDYQPVRMKLSSGDVPKALRIHRAKMSQKGAVKYFKPKWEPEVPVKVQMADDGIVHFAAESQDEVRNLVQEYRREPTTVAPNPGRPDGT